MGSNSGSHILSYLIRRVDSYFSNKKNDDTTTKRGRKKVDILASFQNSLKSKRVIESKGEKTRIDDTNEFGSATLRENTYIRQPYVVPTNCQNKRTNLSARKDPHKLLMADQISNKIENSIKDANSMAQHFSSRNPNIYSSIVF